MSAEDVVRLGRKLANQQNALKTVDSYYTGTQPLSFLPPEVLAQVGDRLRSVVVNWPRVIVDSIEERLDVLGFRLSEDQTADADLQRIWQANNLDEGSQLCHIDALVHGRAFVTVWSGDREDTPRIRPESAHQMAVEFEPGTRTVRAALKQWADGNVAYSTLYLPDRVERYQLPRQAPQVTVDPTGVLPSDAGSWELREPAIKNPLGVVPVVPFINRPRLLGFDGESELSDVVPLADAVNKLATDMMVASEYHASPRRYATGMQIPQPGAAASDAERERFKAQVKKEWDEATSSKTWLAGNGVNFGQFTEAALDNFVRAIGMFTGQIAAIAGLPPHYLGVNTDNPASADAIRSAEASLVQRAKRKQNGYGGSWEQVMRLAQQVRDGVADPGLDSLETIWRDPETPTVAQKADAAVKLTTGDNPIIDNEQALEDLGYTPLQIERMRERRQQSVAQAATADVQARIDLAKQLMSDQGLSQAAAFATVGLLQAAGQISADTTT